MKRRVRLPYAATVVVGAALAGCSWPSRAILLDAPAAIAPVSGSVLSTQYPTFRWRTQNPAIDNVQIEICGTIDCEAGPLAVFQAPARDQRAVWTRGLRRGSYFWRVRGMHGDVVSSVASPMALFVVQTVLPRESAPVPARVMGHIVDVDRDGLADVVTTEASYCGGMPGMSNNRIPSITVFPGAAAPAPGSNGVWLPVRTRAVPTTAIASIVSLGDCDADGLAEFAYPSPGAGDVQVFGAQPDSSILMRKLVLVPPITDVRFGSSVAPVQDADLDGTNELVARGTGRVYVARLNSADAAREPPRQIQPPSEWDETADFGASVCSPGDLDGDGAGDLLVGAPGARAVSIHLGLPGNTLIVGPEIQRVVAPAELGTVRFGATLASGGDINGDGVPDMAIGAPALDGSTDRGAVAIYSTSGTQLVPVPLGRVVASEVGDGFGTVVRSAGDFNGDGIGDLAVGAPSYVRRGVVAGRVYIYLGARPPSTALPAAPSVILESDSDVPTGFGRSVSTAGDIDGDGFDDIAVGEEQFDHGTGRVLVFRGGSYSRPIEPQVASVASVAWTLSGPPEGSGDCLGRFLAMR